MRAHVIASVVISGGTREITFTSTGSQLEALAFPEFDEARFAIAPSTFTISGAANSFTGAITSGSGSDPAPLAGLANGRFYGPAAEELGGTILRQSDDRRLRR